MHPHRVPYFADGQEVIISDSDFQVRNISYPLSEIYSYRVNIILPHRTPFIFLAVIGALVFFCGTFDFLPAALNDSMSLFGVSIFANAAVMMLGIAVMFLGLFAMFYWQDKYVVKVSTPQGEKTVLTSHRLEYVSKISEALYHAHLDQKKKPARGRYSR